MCTSRTDHFYSFMLTTFCAMKSVSTLSFLWRICHQCPDHAAQALSIAVNGTAKAEPYSGIYTYRSDPLMCIEEIVEIDLGVIHLKITRRSERVFLPIDFWVAKKKASETRNVLLHMKRTARS